MYNKLSDIKKGGTVHFIGIGGVSMSALASILMSRGYKVTGSDSGKNIYTERLKNQGATIFEGHDAKNTVNADAVIYSAAIKPDNPERSYAESNNILCMERSTLLGEIETMYSCPIDVSGTHGKTSTTGMLAHIYMGADVDPTVLIGGDLSILEGNMHIGGNDFLISEACEYHRSFLDFHPEIAIILDIEADHLDYYKDLDDIKDAFRDFAHLAGRAVVINADDENTVDTVKGMNNVITTSRINKADFYAENVTCDSFGAYSFSVYSEKEGFLSDVKLSVPGLHHVSNALCAYAAAYISGISPDKISKGLSAFKGAKRRFELKGTEKDIRVYDDYAHHPTEIRATLDALSKMPGNKHIIFQPHTYTRTITLFDDFVSVLSLCDNLTLLPIYAAREKDTGIVSSEMLAGKIKGSYLAKDFEDAKKHVLAEAAPHDIIMTVGAGDVFKIGEDILNELKK
ncbi:MAG: UDP-N-acetylmuramate--L-alanine ligase [Clostridia bacterium]|nr:UDP-N-acetylmuramate--L-alanine ligase [Clostridia bacterium]